MIEADTCCSYKILKQVFDEEDEVEGGMTKQSTTSETELKQMWP